VAVLGCGTIGLLVVALAVSAGADVLALDPLPERRVMAAHLGARTTPEPSPDSTGVADLVVDAAGFESSWRTALSLAKPGGDVVSLGLGQAEGVFPMAILVRRGIRQRGQFAYSRADFAQALALLAGDDLDLREAEWITRTPLDEGAAAFTRLAEEPEGYIKILLVP
jgi:L-iditol 2-dehydrogenase